MESRYDVLDGGLTFCRIRNLLRGVGINERDNELLTKKNPRFGLS